MRSLFINFLVRRRSGNKPYLFGEKPSSYDAAVYAFLANLIDVPMECPLNNFARDRETLRNYCQRMKRTYFSDLDFVENYKNYRLSGLSRSVEVCTNNIFLGIKSCLTKMEEEDTHLKKVGSRSLTSLKNLKLTAF